MKFDESLECLNDKSPSSAAESLSGSKGGNGFFMRAENNVKTDSMKYISAKFMVRTYAFEAFLKIFL